MTMNDEVRKALADANARASKEASARRRADRERDRAEHTAELAVERQTATERANALQSAHVELLEAERNRGWSRVTDAMYRPPRRIMGDAALLLRAVPGMAGLFDKVLPAEHVTDAGVRCVCGAVTETPRGMVTGCAGDCGRWFLAGDSSVYRAML